jgi:hypothetical protein
MIKDQLMGKSRRKQGRSQGHNAATMGTAALSRIAVEDLRWGSAR